MYEKPRTGSAVAAATFAAGPAFLLSAGLSTLAQTAGTTQRFDPEMLVLAATVGVMAILVGAVVAVIPCLVGVAILSRIASSFDALRLPVVWGLIGGLSGYVIGSLFLRIDDAVPGVMAVTGALCALAARSCLRWA
jgi:hypothetical protein